MRCFFILVLLFCEISTTYAQSDIKSDRLIQNRIFTIVIDPGHGGIDGGAVGKDTIEKNITLKFSKELQAHLQKKPSLRVYLTRDDDRFIPLDARMQRARDLKANLFISIHADTIDDPSLRGATLYTLSEKASDALSQSLAERENLADSVGGVVPVQDEAVVDILMDLTRRETSQHSVTLARSIVDFFKEKIILIHNPHRSAGFRVLRSTEIPSVLVEIGYLSNSEDEKQINDPLWRQTMIAELAKAIDHYIQVTQ